MWKSCLTAILVLLMQWTVTRLREMIIVKDVWCMLAADEVAVDTGQYLEWM